MMHWGLHIYRPCVGGGGFLGKEANPEGFSPSRGDGACNCLSLASRAAILDSVDCGLEGDLRRDRVVGRDASEGIRLGPLRDVEDASS